MVVVVELLVLVVVFDDPVRKFGLANLQLLVRSL